MCVYIYIYMVSNTHVLFLAFFNHYESLVDEVSAFSLVK